MSAMLQTVLEASETVSPVPQVFTEIEEEEHLALSGKEVDVEGGKFQLSAKKFHLTYKTHLDHALLLEKLEQACGGELKWYSIVHELGTKRVAYPHTHVAFEATKKVVSRSVTKFDFTTSEGVVIHPNIRVLATDLYVKRVWEYHEKDPVLRTVSVHCPVKAVGWLEKIRDCTSLIEAVQVAGVEPKTVACVLALMNSRDHSQVIPPIVNACSWTLAAPDDFHALFVTGGTGLGKTRWALSRFESPLLVSHLEDLKLYRPDRHDGIVFDDMSFTSLSPQVAIHLLDWEMPRTFNVKHGSVTIHAETRKIFTSNDEFYQVFPVMTDKVMAACRRRCPVIHIHGKTYDEFAERSEDAQPEEGALSFPMLDEYQGDFDSLPDMDYGIRVPEPTGKARVAGCYADTFTVGAKRVASAMHPHVLGADGLPMPL